jgi:hypothetical protein
MSSKIIADNITAGFVGTTDKTSLIIGANAINRIEIVPDGDIKVAGEIVNDLGKKLSSNDYTTDEKNKLAAITEANQVLSFRKSGDGTGISTLNITSSIDATVTITNGYLYADALGAGQTTSINITHNVATNIHFKVTKNNGFISTKNIIRIDSFTDRVNSPIPYFSLANLPAGLTYLNWEGNNTGTGDIANLPAGLTYLSWWGNNTGTGDIANLPAGLTYFIWWGNNTGTGDIANLPAGLTYFGWGGNNTGTGDIANLPAGLTYFIWWGNNTGTGDIANLPAGLTFFGWWGNNTGAGDITNLPTGLTYLYWGGNNTGTGDIANLPTGLTLLSWSGNNTGTGDITNLPTGLTYLYWGGNNTGTGDIANLPAGLTYLYWGGNNTGTFSSSRAWATNMRYVSISPAVGVFSSSMTDALLISLSGQSLWIGEKTIDLRGNCGARTTASDNAVSSLQSYGVTVLTN